MEELFLKAYDQFEAGLQERMLKVIQRVSDEKQIYPLELNKKQCAKMLGIDVKTFDMRFNCHENFPRIEGRREKYPRDAVIDWYHENWMKTGA